MASRRKIAQGAEDMKNLEEQEEAPGAWLGISRRKKMVLFQDGARTVRTRLLRGNRTRGGRVSGRVLKYVEAAANLHRSRVAVVLPRMTRRSSQTRGKPT